MAIKVAVQHHTHYLFDRSVDIGPHIVRLRPAPHSRTPISAYSLKIKPIEHFVNWQQDPFGNYLARLVFPKKSRELTIETELIADMTVINPFDFFLEESAEYFPFAYPARLKRDLAPYLEVSENGRLLRQRVKKIDLSRCATADFLVALNQELQREVTYDVRMEAGVQAGEKTLERGIGSCRDSAWLLVQILRHLGLAARFASGYLVQLAADQKPLDGPSGPTGDFTDLHAWTEVYIPGAGWVGLDPTSGLFTGEGHIPLACAPEPASAAAITGATSKCEVDFQFSNKVMRIHETPRVTKPMDETQWQTIVELGNNIEKDLQANGVNLTMGGEPTFVSVDDMESEQWNTAVLGDDKRRLAGQLHNCLQNQFARNGVPHYGQGKWHLGEPLPRWSLSAYWRKDGLPVWHDPQWLSDHSDNTSTEENAAESFLHCLAEKLALDSACILPAYEDSLYYLWKDCRLPENVDVLNHKLGDPLERERLGKLLQEDLGHVSGYVLPLNRTQGNNWSSCPWRFKTHTLFLLPGDSSIGWRLPLETLQWLEPKAREIDVERDPFEDRRKLSRQYGVNERKHSSLQKTTSPDEGQKHTGTSAQEDSSVVYTALCTEAREGKLFVFLPSLVDLEDWLELISVIESVAAELKLPIILEGYPPPNDSRLQKLSVTPGQGVIEVDIQPTYSWQELIKVTEILHEHAHQSRLGTEKFMLDGKHTGTGGGNHVTLGGATASESPFLRRPDLLASLITFWQHHPSLSYLFSGMFIGPAGQAPRVDEIRSSHLYELEIALHQIPDGDSQQPWLVDRILRNFFVDLTGSTHRAEFCIDRLYSPDRASDRLGIVQFRNFEMPPHPRMSLLQMLLLRGLTSHFWQQPLRRKLVRWGTQLHDRFMLPHFVWQDFASVIEQLNDAGYTFDQTWFESFFEFRFPFIGELNINTIQLELRTAIEPWHVLGEENATPSTARYVDSSLERLQLKIQGFLPERYQVTCNGHALPLHNTGTEGEYVAGVRYKAWAPSSALHPTIGVHVPLIFDVLDTWNKKSIGGCTYHVSHAGGRNYDTFPVNANEAEARRVARFWPHGHTQGIAVAAKSTIDPECPYTLDLRRYSIK